TGVDNKPGDVLVVVPDGGEGVAVVIECRDESSPAGRRPINDAVEKALRERGACRGIYLARNQAGLALEIGDWAEGVSAAGPWVATTIPHLVTALRFSVALERVQRTLA